MVASLWLSQLNVIADSKDTPWLEKDVSELSRIYSGQWNNDRHVFFAKDSGIDLDTVPSRLNVKILNKSENLEENGGDSQSVFQVSVSGVDVKVEKRTETFSILPEKGLIRQKFYNISEIDESEPIECVIDWQREGTQFRGLSRGSGCSSLYPSPVGRKKLTQIWTLSDSEFWILSKRGNDQIEARLRRVRPFECWVSILRGAKHGDSGKDLNDWDFRRGVKLHDQGGTAEIMTDEVPSRKIRLVLRDVEWPYGRNRPSLVLYVMEGDTDRAVSYSWGESRAERIGINLRWIQASCTHKPSSDK